MEEYFIHLPYFQRRSRINAVQVPIPLEGADMDALEAVEGLFSSHRPPPDVPVLKTIRHVTVNTEKQYKLDSLTGTIKKYIIKQGFLS